MGIKSGDVYGLWTVESFAYAKGPYNKFKYWNCKCSCGTIRTVITGSLTSGKSKSCGCVTVSKMRKKRKDFTGLTVNKLKVIKEISYRQWEVLCQCGKTFAAATSQLSGKHAIKSCGCETNVLIRKAHTTGDAYLNYLYRNYKRGADKRRLTFELTTNQFEDLVKQNCIYCGAEPNDPYHGTSYLNKFKHNGIDRVDSNEGYVTTNVVACCRTCNVAKASLTVNEFKQWIIKLYNNLIKIGDK